MKVEIDIINLTPHSIDYIKPNGEVLNFPSKGAARVRQQNYREMRIGDIRFVNYESDPYVEGLPPKEDPSRIYIVSSVVQTVMKGRRHDLISPTIMERDKDGNVICCRAFKL